MSSKKPIVRIGMIQSADEIYFASKNPFSFCDMAGKKIASGKSDHSYMVKIYKAQPSEIRYCVRLAIAEEEDVALNIQADLEKRGIITVLWRPGLVLQLANRTFDNREYWLITGPFQNHQAAFEYTKKYEPIGEAVVVKDIAKESKGLLQCEDIICPNGLRIVPENENSTIELHNVTVGIEFHWQHKKTQLLPGILEINMNNNGKLLAINELDIETYLISVNSSEMTKENPIELLKAQTIAARSTILATMGKHHYDENFHICADDHCQCYHGVANISEASRQAAKKTEGENLLYKNRICDARYAKICGGIMEDYRYVWDHREVPYLVSGIDGNENIEYPIDDETKILNYINNSPDVWCNTQKYEISSSLPYNTRDLFRWKVSYTRKDLEDILIRRLGQDFGSLIDIITGKRGHSGRLIYIDIIGSKKNIRVGKELQIRRALSESHLYSACFYIDRERDDSSNVILFHLKGAGWGHGVGLCQVGATVMAQKGFGYKEILAHYYKNSTLEKLY